MHLASELAACNGAKAPFVAPCYSGEFRTLDVIHDAVRAATASFGGSVASFFYLTAPTPQEDRWHAHGTANGRDCHRVRSINVREGGKWTTIKDSAVHATLKRFSEWSCAVHAWYTPFNGDDALPLCHGDKMQYWKLQQVYLEVQRYEVASGRRFDWLLRMRTDVWFLGPLPSPSSLSITSVHVPFGMVNPSVSVNDQIALVPRDFASAYFDAVDDLSCNASKHSGQVRKFSDKTFLLDRLRHTHAPLSRMDVGFVLLRAGIGAACWRLKSHKRTMHWWSACLNLSTTMPVYCVQPDGTGHPSSNGGIEQLEARRKMLAYSNAPRCNELPGAGWQRQIASFAGKRWPLPRDFVADGSGFHLTTTTKRSPAADEVQPYVTPQGARARNLRLCTARLSVQAARSRFGIDTSALEDAGSAVWECQRRVPPHSGSLYVTDFLSREELWRLHVDWPSEQGLYGYYCDADRGELQGFARWTTSNCSLMLRTLERRIMAVTGLEAGKFAHKGYMSYGGTATGLPLHHDANGACCGNAKRSQTREMTVLLYTRQSELRGGHTVFPFVSPSGEGRAPTVSNRLWRKWANNIYMKAGYESPDARGQYRNSTAGGLLSAACAALAEDDNHNEDRQSSHFAMRPAAGDAFIFWMKSPGKASADPYQYHAACPLLSGSKAAIQKFMQRGGSPQPSPEAIARGPPTKLIRECSK